MHLERQPWERPVARQVAHAQSRPQALAHLMVVQVLAVDPAAAAVVMIAHQA